MEDKILGLHHITAIANNAKRNLDFYTKILGLRLVKKTVNFDDPGTYHFYFGDEKGTPGSILTFFPWEGIGQGRNGIGMATQISYSVPEGSLDFWKKRFETFHVKYGEISERMGEKHLDFTDPDGLNLSLTVPASEDKRIAWESGDVKEAYALKGFHGITLTLKDINPTADILTDVFEYKLIAQEGNTYRYKTDEAEGASIVDIVHLPAGNAGYNAAGTNHHVAFRVANDEILMRFREKISKRGLHITPKINRDYFFSLYFREPGGVLFELATDNPGFTVDERLEDLGTELKLPVQYQSVRADIEKVLPDLN